MPKDQCTELTPVRPVRPAAGYIGGKKNLARRLSAANSVVVPLRL